MKPINKYILSLIIEIPALMLYIIAPKQSLMIIGARQSQVNILGILLFFSLHSQMEYFRDKLVENDLRELKKINKIISIIKFIFVLIAVYRLQMALDKGI